MNTHAERSEKLESLLSRVQKEAGRDEFIYGVTNTEGRGLISRIKDFFIEINKVPLKEKAYFFELLGTMVRAGIPLNKALKILTARTENLKLGRVITTLSYELEHGRPLSSAMDRFPDIFEETERGAVRSAEAIGNLEKMLFKIAANLERRSDLTQRLASALIYPAAVLISLVIAVTVMLMFVVPRMQELFSQTSVSLPLSTKILLGGSVFLTNFWWLIFILIILGVIAFHTYVNSEDGRFNWDFKKLRIPLFGPILRKLCVLRFMDTLGMLTESGLPIDQALRYAADASGNEVYRVKAFEALAAIQEGKRLSSCLAQAPFLFPETVTNMIAVGEHAASLSDISQKISEHFQREIDYTLKNMTTVLGPLVILLIGSAVAFFALAVMSPIFSLTQVVQ